MSLEEGIDEGCEGATFGKDDEHAQQDDDKKEGKQPVTLAIAQESPELSQERGVFSNVFSHIHSLIISLSRRESRTIASGVWIILPP